MSDIVKRAREARRVWDDHMECASPGDPPNIDETVWTDAADEIERLREALGEIAIEHTWLRGLCFWCDDDVPSHDPRCPVGIAHRALNPEGGDDESP